MEAWQYLLIGFIVLVIVTGVVSIFVFSSGGANGACIKADGTCTSTNFSNCIGALQGTFYGDGLTCSDIGTCIMSDGSNCTNTTRAGCTGSSSITVNFTPGVTCPIGACIYNTPSGMKCTDTTEGICKNPNTNNFLNGTFTRGNLCPLIIQ